ncbi:MAG: hypothetical protein H6711_25070 [Myxococcales bacterium]|nr:hypothetical protein [Myxococcales bacterium]
MPRLVRLSVLLLVAACDAPASSGPAPADAQANAPAPAPAEPTLAPPPREPIAPPRAAVPACDAALAPMSALRSPSGPPQAPGPELAPIGAFLEAIDRDLGGGKATDLAAGLRSASGQEAQIAAFAAVDARVATWLREQLRRAAEGADDRPGAWAAAECGWEFVAPTLADTLATEALGETIAARFADGRIALAGPAEGWDRVLLPARQAIEKRIFTAAQRRLLAEVNGAHATGGVLGARRAAAAFALIADRLQDKNTPAIATIEAMLAGPPDKLDPPAITRELAIAFAKRARKYCSEVASHPELLGTPAGLASVTEGATYSRLILPDMESRLGDKLSGERYLAAWEGLLQAVEESDSEEVQRLSDEVVAGNCAYQEALGIPECTWTHDQAAPKPSKKRGK